MDIVSKVPFELKMIKRFPWETCQEAGYFSDNDREIWEKEDATLAIEENDEVEILFDSEDSDARLYLEALDIIPIDDRKIHYDQDGYLYRNPDKEPFILYKSNSGFDELCVDTFQISVLCYDKWYYGTLRVDPKPMSRDEWIMMKEDLEKEVMGLSKEVLRKRLGFQNANEDDLSMKVLYDFMLIKKYAQSVLAALFDIAERPRCEIVTTYETVPRNKNTRFDAKSMKHYLMRPGTENFCTTSVKSTNYDIKDNRLLKRMIMDYDNRLSQFLDFLKEFQEHKRNILVRNDWIKEISTYEEMAKKLKKITSLLKMQDWYQKVKNVSQENISHSFVMDTRYGTVYQLYLKLQKEDFEWNFHMDSSHIWKRSSYLYEIWCYIRVVRLLSSKYEMNIREKKSSASNKEIFSELKEGTQVMFYNKKIEIKLVYNKPLKLKGDDTTLDSPLYMVKGQNKVHNRPDMMIYVYDRENGWYLGSIALECKYRKISSFWNEFNEERSSLGQLQAYYNNARSKYLCGNFGKLLNMRPVRKVIVLTPDERGNDRKQEDFHICVKSLKPSNKKDWDEELLQEINEAIEGFIVTSQIFQNK